MLGETWAERLIERQTRANDRVSHMIRDYRINCEWVQNGYVMGAPHKGAIEEIRRKVETYNAVGAKTRLLGRDEVAAITGSPASMAGGCTRRRATSIRSLMPEGLAARLFRSAEEYSRARA